MRERPIVFSEGTCSPQSCLPHFPCLTPVRKISREKGAFSPHWWIAVNNASQGTVSRLMTISRALAKVWNPISTVLSEHCTDFYPFLSRMPIKPHSLAQSQALAMQSQDTHSRSTGGHVYKGSTPGLSMRGSQWGRGWVLQNIFNVHCSGGNVVFPPQLEIESTDKFLFI